MEIIPYKAKTEKYGDQVFEYLEPERAILKRRRDELKLTQQQVADNAGIQLRQYQRLESGERNISGESVRIMLSVCEVLKLDPYLFFGKTCKYWNADETEQHIRHLVLPAVENNGVYYFIPEYAYIQLVSQIPYGRITTSEMQSPTIRIGYMISRICRSP